MTTTSWTTSADVPPGPWAAMAADMRRLLAVTAAQPGTTVTGPGGAGQPLLDEDVIAFQVTAKGAEPLTIEFHRAAGDGQAVTSAPGTDALVYAAVSRAARWWGPLLTVDSDADTRATAAAAHLARRLFGDEDGAVTGAPQLSTPSLVDLAIARARGGVDLDGRDLASALTAVISGLIAERDGVALATAMSTGPAK
jgi:hypothetical protein